MRSFVIALAWFVMTQLIRASVSMPIVDDAQWRSLFATVIDAWRDLLYAVAGNLAKVLFLGSIVLSATYLAMDWSARFFLRWRLFNTQEFIDYYLFMKSEIEEKASITISRIKNTIIPLFLLGLTVVLFISFLKTDDWQATHLRQVVLYLGMTYTGSVCFIDAYYVIKAKRIQPSTSLVVAQRYMVWRLVRVLIMVVWLLLLLQVGLPLMLQIHQDFVEEQGLPTFENSLEAVRFRVTNRAGDSEAQQKNTETFLEWMDDIDALTTARLSESQYAEVFLLRVRSDVAQVVVPILTGMFLVYFVWPLIIFRKFFPAAMYVILILLGSGIEKLLEQKVPELFFLPKGSIVATILVIVLIVSRSFLSDQLYESASNERKACESCGRMIEGEALFCSHCGARQTPQE